MPNLVLFLNLLGISSMHIKVLTRTTYLWQPSQLCALTPARRPRLAVCGNPRAAVNHIKRERSSTKKITKK